VCWQHFLLVNMADGVKKISVSAWRRADRSAPQKKESPGDWVDQGSQ
jgi:hypothetical protein